MMSHPVAERGRPPLVWVVILTWNNKRDTLACLESLRASQYPHLEILVVDNGSSDDTLDAVTHAYPSVHQLALATNLGFAAGCNRGIEAAMKSGADWVLLLNNDTLVAPDLLEQLVASAGDGVGIVAPRIYYAHDTELIWSSGARRHALTLEMTGSLRGVREADAPQKALPQEYVVGCALMLSRPLLKVVQGFDERFFMYYEDMDLCLRAQRAGYQITLTPKAKVWHKVAATSGGSDSPNERYWMARSSVLFFAKHATPAQLAIVIPYRFGSMVKTLLRLSLGGRWLPARAYVRGIRDGLRDVLTRVYAT